jgi:hypothetical protein
VTELGAPHCDGVDFLLFVAGPLFVAAKKINRFEK